MAEGLSADRIGALVRPFLDSGASAANEVGATEPPTLDGPEARSELPADLFSQLAAYLELLLRWNARTNLTAIREPEQIVLRHFGESLFAGQVLSPRLAEGATLLDVGSGGGFPGLPIQLLRPDLRVMLAESQGKKAAFLREAVRTLGLKTEIFAARVETMPLAQGFDSVTLRAVDKMEQAVHFAAERVSHGGWLAALGDGRALSTYAAQPISLPGRTQSFLELARL